MDDYQKFIHLSRYARWREEDNRRETWEETVNRLIHYYSTAVSGSPKHVKEAGTFNELKKAILNMEVMPSMRAMMTAGPALDRDNVAAYNCAYLPVDHPYAFDETMYILMCGTGVGFSVERHDTDKLPEVPDTLLHSDVVITVADSKIGWAKSFRQLIALLYAGSIPRWDVSKVRPSGERLKTFGGRASGPEPLVKLFNFTVGLFEGAKGRRLNPIECHDLMCMVGDVVVVGGVRRSAMISLSDLGSEQMAKAKSGAWWEAHVHRQLANNSAVYEGKPGVGEFLKEWKHLYDSKSGERGIYNREASRKVVERSGRRDPEHRFGTNPCSEIILRPNQFCNLTEVVVRAEDGIEELRKKVRLATILGTIQSTFTEFRYLRSIWRKNTEEERLLGVSLTGIADNNMLWTSDGRILNELRDLAVEVNAEWADRLGIPRSAAITCVKPSGTVSQLVNSASGIHPRYSRYYLRTVRNDVKDPISRLLQEAGVPNEPDQRNPSALVFSFPQQAPESAALREDVAAVDFLDKWKMFQEHYTEHKPSVTISVKEDEWLDVGAWVYNNFDVISGVSFLPFDPKEYPQAPYQVLTEEQYKEWLSKMPEKIDWTKLSEYEKEDMTTGTQELACTGNICEI